MNGKQVMEHNHSTTKMKSGRKQKGKLFKMTHRMKIQQQNKKEFAGMLRTSAFYYKKYRFWRSILRYTHKIQISV